MSPSASPAPALDAPDFGAGALAQVAADTHHVLSLPAPAAPPWAALPDAADDVSLIAPDDGAIRVGWGTAARAVRYGPARLSDLCEDVRHLHSVWGEVELFAGFAFEPDSGEAWRHFGDAQVHLPRFCYVRRGAQAWLRVAVDPSADRAALQTEVSAALARLRRPRAPTAVVARAVAAKDREAWRAGIRLAQATMARGDAQKVVLSRTIGLEAEPAPSPRSLVAGLLDARAPGTRFLFHREGASFFGITPERLVRVQGERVDSAALAGSRPAAEDPAGLLDDPKERQEHALVRAHVLERLAPWCDDLEAAEVPQVLRLGYVSHLFTPVRGRRARAGSALELAGALHPTPAVCGVPVPQGHATIREAEGRPRGWYTGGVGVLGPGDAGELWVALRAARLDGAAGQAYVGAGILPGSDPDKEWAETEAKAAAVLDALGAR